jgi:hypothetical protein
MRKHPIITVREAAGLLFVLALSTVLPPQSQAADRSLLRLFDGTVQQPGAFHLGLDYLADNAFVISTEGTRRRNGLAEMEGGLEWRGISDFRPRFGYRPDFDSHRPGFLTNMAAGVRMKLFGEQVVYAVAPFQKEGASHYVSITKRFR